MSDHDDSDEYDNHDLDAYGAPSSDHEKEEGRDPADKPAAMPVDIGKALPPAMPDALPLLTPAAPVLGAASDLGPTGSTIAQGMHFTGNVTLSGSCRVAGEVEGHLRHAEDRFVAVVVTETGRVNGDITAQRISVMGHTEGILDAGTGEVSLHDGSNVNGIVRYGRIQVNGANLNATLERVVAR